MSSGEINIEEAVDHYMSLEEIPKTKFLIVLLMQELILGTHLPMMWLTAGPSSILTKKGLDLWIPQFTKDEVEHLYSIY